VDKIKILIVDDEPMFIEVMKERLEANNCEVISAVNGKEGIEKIEKDKPDVLFLDILMPVLDGMSALEIIREKYKDLPVFMLTSFSTDDRKREAERIGAAGFITKDGDIKEEIQEVLSQLRDKS